MAATPQLDSGVMAAGPSISVVIPCRNGAATLGRQLAALARQEYRGSWEVILADNGSDDGSADLARRWSDRLPGLRVVDASLRPGANMARNAGIRAASGDIVALCDADDEVDERWLHEMVSTIAAGADLVGGALDLTRLNAGLSAARKSRSTALQDTLGFLPWAEGSNQAFRREVFDHLGGFDETSRYQYLARDGTVSHGADEIEFSWRAQLAGFRLTFAPDAVVHYAVRSSPRALFREFLRYGKGHVALYQQFRVAGMPRSRTKLAIGRWAWLAMHAPRALRPGEDREAVIRRTGLSIGRLMGSLKHRVWYL